METTTFDLDFLLSSDRGRQERWDSSWLSSLPPSSSSLCGLCGLSPHESARFHLYRQRLLDGFTGCDASYNSLTDSISNPMAVSDDFPLFLDPLESSWDTYGLSGHDIPCSMSLGDSWVYQALNDLISPQNYTNTTTAFPATDDTKLERLELASGAPITGLYDETLLQYANDSNIQAPSGASSDCDSGCADDTDAIVLTGEGSVLTKALQASRPVSKAASQTDISTARIKSTGALDDNVKFMKVPILGPPVYAKDLPMEDTSSEDLPAKRRKISLRSPPGKRRKTTSPYAKSRKPSPDEHNFRIGKITYDNRKYQWSRRKRVWESDGDLLEGNKVPFDEVTEVEVFPNGQSSQQVVLSREGTGLFCGTDEVWERHYSLEGDTILRLIMNPDEARKAPESIV